MSELCVKCSVTVYWFVRCVCGWVGIRWYLLYSHTLTYTLPWLHNFTHTSHRTSCMFKVVSMCEGCCEVFGEVYWTAYIFSCCEFLWVFQIYYFLFKDTVRSVCAEEIRKVSVSVWCFSELYVKHILLHTLQLFIFILSYFLQIPKTSRMKVNSFEPSKFIIFF